MQVYTADNLKETENLAKTIAKTLVGGEIILLNGELGAGKTTFTKFLAVALGIKKEVLSPTYTILKEYDGALKLYHIDMYRLKQDEYQMLGLEDFVGDKHAVTVIEWNKMPLPNCRIIEIDIEYSKNNSRIFNVRGFDEVIDS